MILTVLGSDHIPNCNQRFKWRRSLTFSILFLFYRLASYLKSLFLATTLDDVLIPLFAISCPILSAIGLSPKCHSTAERVLAGDQLETSPR